MTKTENTATQRTFWRNGGSNLVTAELQFRKDGEIRHDEDDTP